MWPKDRSHTGQGLPFKWFYHIFIDKFNSDWDRTEGGRAIEKESRKRMQVRGKEKQLTTMYVLCRTKQQQQKQKKQNEKWWLSSTPCAEHSTPFTGPVQKRPRAAGPPARVHPPQQRVRAGRQVDRYPKMEGRHLEWQAVEPVPRGPRKSQLCKEKVNILFLMSQKSKHR